MRFLHIPDRGGYLEFVHYFLIGKVILKDLEKKRAESPTLDPRSASRTPAADREPHYKTRYESPIFACEYFTIYIMFCNVVLLLV